ncbi:DUF222 domain-containing protein [Pseudarthrobacter enclensis]|uniref:HNH endonuclease signature motif containing protein n=1 Tax=Pseudarthrobacter enclensis TaxID=993070 RepID=UPI003EE2B259
MENVAASVAVMEGLRAAVAALDALFLTDAGQDRADPQAVDCEAVDVLERKSELRLERLAVWARLEAQIAAGKSRDAAEFAEFQEAMTPPEATGSERAFVEMSTTAEVAGVLTLSPGAAAAFISQSRKVCAMPAVAGALAAGAMSWRHAVIVADETDCLAPESAEALVAHFFDPDAPHRARGSAPGDLVPSQFRGKVRSWRERTYPDSVQERHIKCVADRRMEYRPDADGMAWINLHLPGDTACAIWNKTTAIARGLQGPDETRTLSQLRPDVAAALLLGAGNGSSAVNSARTGEPIGAGNGTTAPGRSDDGQQPVNTAGSHGTGTHGTGIQGTGTHGTGIQGTDPYAVDLSKIPAPKADVLVTVPVLTLLGSTDEPADLDGYGPIPAAMARRLVANGASSFYRVLVDPRDGAPLEIGRTSYRLTEAMKRWIRMRDGHCTFPGCTNPSTDNDTDHLTAWHHHGTTGVSNLAQLCPKHHRLKHNSGWTPTPATTTEPPGWTSPAGRHYPAQHPDPQPPHWPLGTPCVPNMHGESAAQPETLPAAGGADELKATESLEQRVLSGLVSFPDYLPLDSPGDDEPPEEELAGSHRPYLDDPVWEAFYAAPRGSPQA